MQFQSVLLVATPLPFSPTAHADFVSGFWSLLSLCLSVAFSVSVRPHQYAGIVWPEPIVLPCVVCRQLAAVDMSRSIVVAPPRDPFLAQPTPPSLSPSPSWFNVLTQSHSFSICQHDDILLFAQCLVAFPPPLPGSGCGCACHPLSLSLAFVVLPTLLTGTRSIYSSLPPPTMPTEAGNHCKCEWLCTRNFAVNLTVLVQRFLHWTDSRNDL